MAGQGTFVRGRENVTVPFSILPRNRRRGSTILFLGVLAAGLLTLAVMGWVEGFTALRVPAMYPAFADVRTIPGAWQAMAAGLDPRIDNPGDPWARPFNYPDIWLFLFKPLAVIGDPALVFGVVQAAMLAAVGAVLARRRHGWLAFLVFFSPPALLLLERGNTDGVVMLLTLFALWRGAFAGGAALGLAVALKIFPLFGIAAALLHPTWRRGLAGLVVAAPLSVWSLRQTSAMVAATPGAYSTAFGLRSASLLFLTADSPLFTPGAPKWLVRVLVTLVFVAGAALVWRLLRTAYRHLAAAVLAGEPGQRAVTLGFLGIFLAVFVLGSNFAYRLVVIAPILWGLAPMAVSRHGWLRCGWLAAVSLGVGVLALYAPWVPNGWVPLDGWTLLNPLTFLFAVITAPLAVEAVMQAVPEWLRHRVILTLALVRKGYRSARTGPYSTGTQA